LSDFDHTTLDDLIHSRLRLAIMAALAGVERADFSALKRQVNATDGNLGMHLRKLEEAGYIQADKQFQDRKPVTRYALTDTGKQAFAAYLDQLAAWLPKTRA
jgi:DNA-binding HxlR family transcriptional regulator